MEVLKMLATKAAWVWQTWQNFIQNHCWAGDSVPQEKKILWPQPKEVALFPRSHSEVQSYWERDSLWISSWQEDKSVTYEVSFCDFLIIFQISFFIYTISICLSHLFCVIDFFFFFGKTQTYNNMPTPKLLVTVRVAELLI